MISRVRMGSQCGLNRISPIFDDERIEVGYEYHCKHPLHQKPRYCVKTIKWSESRPKEDCFHILATWAHWGKDDRDRKAHFEATWKRVIEAYEGGALPANPPEVTAWPEVCLPEPGVRGSKRKRSAE